MKRTYDFICPICKKSETIVTNNGSEGKSPYVPITNYCEDCKVYQVLADEKLRKEEEEKKNSIKRNVDKFNKEELRPLQEKLQKEGLAMCKHCFDGKEVKEWAEGKRVKFNYYYNTMLLGAKYCNECLSNKEKKNKKDQELAENIQQSITWVKEEYQQVEYYWLDTGREEKLTIPQLINKVKNQEIKQELINLWEERKKELNQKTNQNKNSKNDKFQELKEKIEKVKTGEEIAGLLGIEIMAAEMNHEITESQAEELEKLLAKNEKIGQKYLEEKEKREIDEEITSQENNRNKSNSNNQKAINNPLPPLSSIQKKYNNDPLRSQITNNPTISTQSDKDRAQKLLKLVVTAELLIEQGWFNQEVLDNLLEARQNNNEVYKFLNNGGRIDKAIANLEQILSRQLINEDSKDDLPLVPAIVGGGVLILITILVIVRLTKKKRRK